MYRCGHCQKLAPEYKKAAEKLAGMVIVGAVDCDVDENKGLCSTYGIQGFPTIKVFSAGVKGMPTDYQGPRTAAAIVNEGISKVRSYLKKCDANGFDELVASNNKSVMVLISEKKEVPVMFKALSAEFNNQVDFCFFKSSDTEFMKKVEVKSFPSLVLFSKDKEPLFYEGALKFKSIKEFLEPIAINRKTKGNSKKKVEKEAPKAKPVCKFSNINYQVDPTIPEVSSQEQLDDCLKKTGVCLISFLTLEPEYQESKDAHTESIATLSAVKKTFFDLGSPFTFVWVNAISHGGQLIKDFGVRYL